MAQPCARLGHCHLGRNAPAVTKGELLFDLDQAVEHCFAAEGKSAQFDRLSQTRSNLLRMWAEP